MKRKKGGSLWSGILCSICSGIGGSLYCGMGGSLSAEFPLRPHVVWFGEEVPMLDEAALAMKNADILIVIGTSLNVYPAAGLIYSVNDKCKKIIIDPKAGEMEIPNDFEIYNLSASEGLQKWRENYTK